MRFGNYRRITVESSRERRRNLTHTMRMSKKDQLDVCRKPDESPKQPVKLPERVSLREVSDADLEHFKRQFGRM